MTRGARWHARTPPRTASSSMASPHGVMAAVSGANRASTPVSLPSRTGSASRWTVSAASCTGRGGWRCPGCCGDTLPQIRVQHLMAVPMPSQLPPAAGNRAASTCWRCPSCPPSGSHRSVPASAPSMPGPVRPPRAGLPAPAWPRRPAVPGLDDAVSQGVMPGQGCR